MLKVSNSHDGPARNQISRGEKTRKEKTEANEVLPSRGSKTRGRQLGEDEKVNEERLPANTRFPPRWIMLTNNFIMLDENEYGFNPFELIEFLNRYWNVISF